MIEYMQNANHCATGRLVSEELYVWIDEPSMKVAFISSMKIVHREGVLDDKDGYAFRTTL